MKASSIVDCLSLRVSVIETTIPIPTKTGGTINQALKPFKPFKSFQPFKLSEKKGSEMA